MKIDNVASVAEDMGKLLKLISSESTEMSKKMIRTNVETRLKTAPTDTMGQNIDTYA
jgi:uncharacterized protein Yka (UPF0111/DUF47 family)